MVGESRVAEQFDDDYAQNLRKIALLRIIVGFLGEKAQNRWWSSEFFSTTAPAFLNPVFSKTTLLARYHGIKEAGCRVHDESIGVGQRVFHLFRLPAALEQRLHESVVSRCLDEEIAAATNSRDTAIAKLTELADGSAQSSEGPIAISNSADFANNDWMATAAQCYLSAFEANTQCFPYIKASS